MQTNNSIGFVVWGVKNGFQNNLFSHNLSESIKTMLIDIQELCMTHYSDFYSIERISNETVVSLYDPTFMDYSGSRKAYIVFSVIFPQGTAPADDIFQLLESFRNYYKVESNGLPSQEIFYRKLVQFQTKSSSIQNYGTKVRYMNYSSLSEIKYVFKELDILDNRKIYFFDKPNNYVSRDQSLTEVLSLVRKYSVEIKNYTQEYEIYINGVKKMNPNAVNFIAVLTDLNKTDKIEIKKRGVLVETFIVQDKKAITLTGTQGTNNNQFTITKLNKDKHYVEVNKIKIDTSATSFDGKLVFPIPQNSTVEVLEKETKKRIGFINTAETKSYQLIVQTYGLNNSSSISSATLDGNLNSNSGLNTTESSNSDVKRPGKSKKYLIGFFLLLIGVGTLGVNLGWFNLQEKVEVKDEVKVETVVGTDEAEISKDTLPQLKCPEGYTLKDEKYKKILTKEGFFSNHRYWRFFNNEWKTKEEDNKKDEWKPSDLKDIKSLLTAYFREQQKNSDTTNTNNTNITNQNNTNTNNTNNTNSNNNTNNNGQLTNLANVNKLTTDLKTLKEDIKTASKTKTTLRKEFTDIIISYKINIKEPISFGTNDENEKLQTLINEIDNSINAYSIKK